MTVEDLRAAVLAVPGVAAADVAVREDGVPVVRVWTDGSRGDPEVQNDVADVIAIHGYGTGTAETGRAALEARLAESVGATMPQTANLEPRSMRGAEPAPSGLAKLIIEESGSEVMAVASDASGRTSKALVGEGPDAFLTAVTEAVAGLRGVNPSPVLLRVEDRLIEGVDVISVLIETGVGERYAGAAVVRGGRPFTVGRAVDAALATAV